MTLQNKQSKNRRVACNIDGIHVNQKDLFPTTCGMGTLEIIIAFAILMIAITGVIIVSFGNQSIAVDSELNNSALYLAERQLEKAYASSTADFSSLASVGSTPVDPSDPDNPFTKKLDIFDVSECVKHATSTISWWTGTPRPQETSFISIFTSTSTSAAMGGDCETEDSEEDWDNPQRFASDTLNPAKSTTIDVLDKIAYLGSDKRPFLAIADTRDAVLGQNSALFVSFANGFNADGKIIDQINDIDVYKNTENGKTYALIAMASSTAQFAIIDVTDIKNPSLVAARSLAGVDPMGSQPNGYRVYYYDKKAYVLTRETSGPEFHIFDVSTPNNPVELGTGTKLIGPTPPNGTTVNDFVIRNGIAYFAAEKDTAELLVYDVSDPFHILHLAGATVNLPGNQNGASVFLLGNKLYLGREVVSGGPEFYIFNASSPKTAVGGLPIVGSPTEVGTDVLAIRGISRFAFLATSKSKEEFQVWNVPTSGTVSLIKKYNFGNIIAGGIEYEQNFIYSTGAATPNFQILYNKPN